MQSRHNRRQFTYVIKCDIHRNSVRSCLWLQCADERSHFVEVHDTDASFLAILWIVGGKGKQGQVFPTRRPCRTPWWPIQVSGTVLIHEQIFTQIKQENKNNIVSFPEDQFNLIWSAVFYSRLCLSYILVFILRYEVMMIINGDFYFFKCVYLEREKTKPVWVSSMKKIL